jgi:hypothetical protein
VKDKLKRDHFQREATLKKMITIFNQENKAALPRAPARPRFLPMPRRPYLLLALRRIEYALQKAHFFMG